MKSIVALDFAMFRLPPTPHYVASYPLLLGGLYVVSPVKKKKQERSFGNLPTLIFLDNEQVHPVRSMESPKFFLSRLRHNTLFLKVAN